MLFRNNWSPFKSMMAGALLNSRCGDIQSCRRPVWQRVSTAIMFYDLLPTVHLFSPNQSTYSLEIHICYVDYFSIKTRRTKNKKELDEIQITRFLPVLSPKTHCNWIKIFNGSFWVLIFFPSIFNIIGSWNCLTTIDSMLSLSHKSMLISNDRFGQCRHLYRILFYRIETDEWQTRICVLVRNASIKGQQQHMKQHQKQQQQ